MNKALPPVDTQQSVRFSAYSSKGLKQSNDDAYATLLPQDPANARFKGSVACIADGISYSKNSALASQLACTSFLHDYYSTPDFWPVKRAAASVIRALNAWLHQQNRNLVIDLNSSRVDSYVTTFSVIIIKSHTAHIFHVGDSRIYRSNGDGLVQLTQDHVYAQDLSRPQLIRALGYEETVDIDYLTVPVTEGDRFLLTTDGVHGVLSRKNLGALLNPSKNALGDTANTLVEAAQESGSEDNMTAVVLDILTLPPAEITEIYQRLSSQTIPPILAKGQTIDHYEILKPLAKESRSNLYLVLNKLDGKKYVLKTPSRKNKDDREYMEGFAREQWIGLRMNHSGLMKIFEQPPGSRFLYYVSEYIEGINLKQWMSERTNLTLAEAISILKEMIKPVRYMHRNNLLHRDLKPENFIINQGGALKLIDFGTVRIDSILELSRNNEKEYPVGDIGYIAPEILVTGHSSSRSDLFSLACIVYEMITGEQPYSAILTNKDQPGHYDQWIYRPISRNRKLLLQPPPWLDIVMKKALAPDPRNRYSTLSEFLSDLTQPSAEIIQSASFQPFIERNPLLFWKVLSLILTTLLIAETLYLFSD